MKTLSFGETLWDIFTDSRCLGSAPLNVAGHLSRLGFDAYIVSALGADELGMEALIRMADSGVKTDFVSTLSNAATGFTHIVLSHGIPDYEFNYPCAWDLIALSGENLNKIRETDWDVFCFGTLAQRSDVSRSTLKDILPEVKAKIVFWPKLPEFPLSALTQELRATFRSPLPQPTTITRLPSPLTRWPNSLADRVKLPSSLPTRPASQTLTAATDSLTA